MIRSRSRCLSRYSTIGRRRGSEVTVHYTRRIEADDCTIVWPDGSIVNKQADLESMTGGIVFSEFKIDDVRVRLYGDAGIVVGQGTINAQKGKQDLISGKFVWTDTFVKQGNQWKVVASQITPVLEK